MAGIATVRAFAAQTRFIRNSNSLIDNCNSSHFHLWATNRWLAVRLWGLGAVVLGVIAVVVVYDGDDGVSDAASGALVLMYATQLTQAIMWLVRTQAQLEMEMNAVERTEEYSKVEQEAPATAADTTDTTTATTATTIATDTATNAATTTATTATAAAEWPTEGELHVENLTLQYPNSSKCYSNNNNNDTSSKSSSGSSSVARPVLVNVSFHVLARSRVGIVGRTGSGKSTLINALFRIVEPLAGVCICVYVLYCCCCCCCCC